MSTQFTSPVMRLVQGGMSLQPKTDDQNKPILDKTTGLQVQECFMAGAIAKNDPALPEFWGLYNAVAQAQFPHLFDAAGNCLHPRFAFKRQDGDGVDQNGKSVAGKEGFAGHIVFKFATRYAPKCYVRDSAGQLQLLENPDAYIKRGYYIVISGTLDGNGVGANAGSAIPGLYASPNLVLFIRPGTEIVSGPNPNDVFANIQSQQGIVPATAGVPAAFAAAGTGAALPGLPGAAAAGLPALPGNVAPAAAGLPGAGLPALGNPGMLAGTGAAVALPQIVPATGGMPTLPGAGLIAPPAAAPQYQMTASAQGATREQLLGAGLGWTDEKLVEHGHMIRVG